MPRTPTNFQKFPLVPFSKAANSAYGGDGAGESSFESAFADMAHAHLRSRAPMLLDYELGFQLLDKDEDNRRAQGVFGFQVGDTLLLAPMFFDKGEVKGYELLNIQKNDMYVPLKENWINYLMGRKPMIIGRPTNRDTDLDRGYGPDLRAFNESPLKYAAANRDWFATALPGLAHALSKQAAVNLLDEQRPCYTQALVKASSEAAYRLVQAVAARPTWGPELERHFPGLLKTALESAKLHGTLTPNRLPARPVKQAVDLKDLVGRALNLAKGSPGTVAISQVSVRIFDGTPQGDLEDQEKEKLLMDGVLVKDDREDDKISTVIPENHPLCLYPCSESGVYTTLTSTGLREMVLLVHPMGAVFRLPGTIMVDKEDKTWAHIADKSIQVRDAVPDRGAFRSWWESLPTSKELEKDSTYILVGKDGDCTAPLVIGPSRPSKNGTAYRAHILTDGGRAPGTTSQMYRNTARSWAYSQEKPNPSGSLTVWFGLEGDGGCLDASASGDLYVPSDYRALKVEDSAYTCGPTPDEGPCSEQSPAPAPGRSLDLELLVKQATEPLELKLAFDGNYRINGGKELEPRRALKTLVEDWGLREKTARDMLSTVDREGRTAHRVKFAASYTIPNNTGPSEEYGGLPVQEAGTVLHHERPTPQPTRDDPRHMRPSSEMMSGIDNAVRTGQRELIDASMVSNLLKQNQEDTLIDQHLSSLARSVDSYGRLLMGLYGNPDVFRERFGDKELKRMEDSFRTNFLAVGDDLLFLRQNHVDPFSLKDQEIDIAEPDF